MDDVHYILTQHADGSAVLIQALWECGHGGEDGFDNEHETDIKEGNKSGMK